MRSCGRFCDCWGGSTKNTIHDGGPAECGIILHYWTYLPTSLYYFYQQVLEAGLNSALKIKQILRQEADF